MFCVVCTDQTGTPSVIGVFDNPEKAAIAANKINQSNRDDRARIASFNYVPDWLL